MHLLYYFSNQCNAELAHLGNKVLCAGKTTSASNFLCLDERSGPEAHSRSYARRSKVGPRIRNSTGEHVPGMQSPRYDDPERSRAKPNRDSLFLRKSGAGLQIEGGQLPNPVERKASPRFIPPHFRRHSSPRLRSTPGTTSRPRLRPRLWSCATYKSLQRAIK